MFALAFGIGFALSAHASRELPLGTPLRGSLDWRNRGFTEYRVEVPADAIALTIEIEDAPVHLDIYARHGAPIRDYETDPEHWTEPDRLRDSLRISRTHSPPLQSGVYYVAIAYDHDALPVPGKHRLATIPFTVRASVIGPRVDATLAPGTRVAGRTTQEDGSFRTYVVDVPAGTRVMRIDLDEVEGDLDIAARRDRQIVAPSDADAGAATALGRETLLLDDRSSPPLTPGKWFVDVYDPSQQESVAFALHVRFERGPPKELLEIPDFSAANNDIDRAVRATVELIGQEYVGSGTLISPDGLILTNFHVVQALAGGVTRPGELVIGATLDDRRPSVELFRGRVLVADEAVDLALVEVSAGLYGQALPRDYRFPYLALGDPGKLGLGSPVSLLGFPGTGGTGSRASVTFSRGVVSGFELNRAGVLIKTDAEMSPGNSGGAAIDENCRLVGIPTAVVQEEGGTGQIGYIYPVDLLPRAWQEIVRGRIEGKR